MSCTKCVKTDWNPEDPMLKHVAADEARARGRGTGASFAKPGLGAEATFSRFTRRHSTMRQTGRVSGFRSRISSTPPVHHAGEETQPRLALGPTGDDNWVIKTQDSLCWSFSDQEWLTWVEGRYPFVGTFEHLFDVTTGGQILSPPGLRAIAVAACAVQIIAEDDDPNPNQWKIERRRAPPIGGAWEILNETGFLAGQTRAEFTDENITNVFQYRITIHSLNSCTQGICPMPPGDVFHLSWGWEFAEEVQPS